MHDSETRSHVQSALMPDAITINDHIAIDEDELVLKAVRASGPVWSATSRR